MKKYAKYKKKPANVSLRYIISCAMNGLDGVKSSMQYKLALETQSRHVKIIT